MKKIHYIFIVLFLGLMIFPNVELLAQCTGPVGDGGDCCAVPPLCGPTCPPCTPVPLDGGLSALLIAGVAFGAKKLRGNFKA